MTVLPLAADPTGFQSFEAATSPSAAAPRLERLRQEMATAKLNGFLVPRADAHRGENVAPSDERLAWLTGFTGSAGLAAITANDAVVMVDGRYTLQVRQQCDGAVFTFRTLPAETLADWLKSVLPNGGMVGFDPWLHSFSEIDTLRSKLTNSGIKIVAADNLVDAIWDDRPAGPATPMRVHPMEFAGRDHADKRAAMAAEIDALGVTSMVLSLPDSIAWLLNIRGSDIARTPVPLAFAILERDGQVSLFTDSADPDGSVAAHLGSAVRVRPKQAFAAALADLEGPVGLDKTTAPLAVKRTLAAASVAFKWITDPCVLPKALKNPAELAGMRDAHMRDGAAMVEFLCWLDRAAPTGSLTEIGAVKALENCRRRSNALQDISFDTISGSGPNGAIVHYRVTEETNRGIQPGELLLIDSGGQYLDGTTDITRTVAVNPPREDAKRPFTLVLKGMIALSRAYWPEGTTGRDLDVLARASLWQAGLDYDHGTGHGVGAYLGVHEGPASISRRSTHALMPGMVLSNEPGYYREGAFGIRIENLVAVQGPDIPESGERPMLHFETLTLAPIDRRLIDVTLLTQDERDWVDTYHYRVLTELGELVSPDALDWMTDACAPL